VLRFARPRAMISRLAGGVDPQAVGDGHKQGRGLFLRSLRTKRLAASCPPAWDEKYQKEKPLVAGTPEPMMLRRCDDDLSRPFVATGGVADGWVGEFWFLPNLRPMDGSSRASRDVRGAGPALLDHAPAQREPKIQPDRVA